MEDFFVILILVAITAGIIWYFVRAKMKGEKCIGCPYCKQCANKCHGGCSGKSENR